jgi:hypothetical protein
MKRTVSSINSLDTSVMVNLIPVIRQYKRTGLVAIHRPAVGSRQCDCTFHFAAFMILELNVKETERHPLSGIEHVPLIFVCYVAYTLHIRIFSILTIKCT